MAEAWGKALTTASEEAMLARAKAQRATVMGSGTTGVACVQLGRSFMGIEVEAHFFDIACQRMHAALAQPDLFLPQPSPPQQQPLFAGGR